MRRPSPPTARRPCSAFSCTRPNCTAIDRRVPTGSASGSPRRYSLGPVSLKTVEDARLECFEIGLKEQIGGAPDKTVKMAVLKFRDFVEGKWKTARYDHLKPSGMKSVDSALKSRLLPNFGTLPLDRITRSRVNRWFGQYSGSAPGGANRVFNTLSGILNHAIVCGHIETNPVRGVRRIRDGRCPGFFRGRKSAVSTRCLTSTWLNVRCMLQRRISSASFCSPDAGAARS